jgi:hypothetical protein
MARTTMQNIPVHIANEHGVSPDGIPFELLYQRHMEDHTYGVFREGQEHYHEEPPDVPTE